jgi:hypothetical protein
VALFVHPDASIAGHVFKLFDVGGVIGAAGLAITFCYAATRHTRDLYRAEPLPSGPRA